MEQETHRKDELEEALESIASMKAAIRGNMQLVRPAIHGRAVVTFCGFCSLGALYFFLLYIVRNIFWSGLLSPSWFIPVVIISLIAFFVIGGIWKFHVLDSGLRSSTGAFGAGGLFKIPEFMLFMRTVWITRVLVFAAGAFIVYRTGNWWYMMPLAFVVFSYDMIQMSYALYLNEYRIAALFGFACALVQAVFMKGNYDLWLTGSITFLLGCIYGTLKVYGKFSAE
jgi:hypothetical protein